MNPLASLKLGQWLLYGAFFFSLVLGYFAWQHHQRDIGRDEMRAEYAAKAAESDAKRADSSTEIAPKAEAAQERIRTVFKTIVKEIPTYVSINDCPMSPGFRVFHDAAANGQLPDPTRIADAESAAADTVANTVADNYQTCHATAARLHALQSWVRAQQGAK